ncbi:diguanylate cyclase [Anoxynatronum sibiricum]|uniref:Stage 0 sporulation protein A homolog n=1 Tax=Anoxynatronum sibiricum TaxID=210623 RepID=A0ABU9VWE3_9CLOT
MARSGKIFIVEDSPLDEQIMKDALLQRGYRIMGVAHSVEEAMPMIMKRKPDLVLMDITLKGEKDGIWAAGQVQNTLGIPVLFVSGLLNEDMMARVLAAEPSGFLVKPFNEKELYINIELALYKSEMKRQLRKTEKRFRSMIQVMPDILIFLNHEGVHLEMFTSDTSLLIKDAEWQIGRRLHDIFQEALAETILTAIHTALETDEMQTIEYMLSLDGKDVYFEMRIIASNENEVLAIIRDITQRKRTEEELIFLRFRDRLTGLYNRDFFEEEIDRLDTERQYPLSVILCDIDGLKLVNDVLGHQEGDKVAVRIANILKDSCREEDIICRTGGDEFTVLLPQTSEADARKIMRRIKRKCDEGMKKGHLTSLSLGASCKTSPGKKRSQLVKEADDAMYLNKMTNREPRLNELLEMMRTHPRYNIEADETYWKRINRYRDSINE